jgi:hypothetical protein
LNQSYPLILTLDLDSAKSWGVFALHIIMILVVKYLYSFQKPAYVRFLSLIGAILERVACK